MLRHSKRCLTQEKPASLAIFRSRSVVSGWPQRKTWTPGAAGVTLPSVTTWTVGAEMGSAGVAFGPTESVVFVPGVAAGAFVPLVGDGGAFGAHAASTKVLRASA